MSIEIIIKKDSSWISQLHFIVIPNYSVNILDSCIKLSQTKCDEFCQDQYAQDKTLQGNV